MRDYVPLKEGLLMTWGRQFANTTSAARTEYGLSEGEAQEIATVVAAFEATYVEAKEPSTRLAGSIVRKNQAKRAMLKVLRRYAQQIRADATISDAHKVNLGLNPAPARAAQMRARVAAPLTRPQLYLTGVTPRRHVLSYSQLEVDGRAKPAGVVALQLFCHVGSAAPADPLDARFVRVLTRKPYRMDFKHEQVGQTAFYFARWQNAKGDTGPWGPVLAMTVAG